MSIATIGAVAATDTELLIPGVPQIPYALLLTGAGGTTEVIEVRSLQHGGHVYVTRGAFGSLAVAHTAPVVVTLYDPNGGGGGGGVTVTGAFVQTISVPAYDQDKIPFDVISYDPGGLWSVSGKYLNTASSSGLYIVSANVSLLLSSPPDNPPEFEVVITHTTWNFDPLVFMLVERFTANRFIGSISMPIVLDENCHVSVDGFWGGAATGEILASALSIFKLGDLA